ncbi:hypothetical protein [Rickettsia endosymbiont of Orchestes rusci]|uniref:hypothetical protein n=1 Tax=Rickettsia endosymbiont of Orchestes rusci TaxID=3066250 RepID=UPI00313BF744
MDTLNVIASDQRCCCMARIFDVIPAFRCHSRAGGNPEKHSHPEFISGSNDIDAETSLA